LQVSRRRLAEIVAVLAVYILFLMVAVYSGNTTMSVDIVNPPDGMRSHSSPVELAVRVTIKGLPVANVTTTFTILGDGTIESSAQAITDVHGISRMPFPALSGNYTWYVTAEKEGYPTIMSRRSSFSITLSLLVEALLPTPQILAVNPVDFKARVTDANRRPVESANVTFYVDSTTVGWSLTSANGIADLSSQVGNGQHVWLASAYKDAQGGVSDPVSFIVGQLTSFVSDRLDSVGIPLLQLGETLQASPPKFWSAYQLQLAMMRSSSALNE
jgi:hypothetical protein